MEMSKLAVLADQLNPLATSLIHARASRGRLYRWSQPWFLAATTNTVTVQGAWGLLRQRHGG